jgi:hypothetical protein
VSRRALLHLCLLATLVGCAASPESSEGEAGPVVHGLDDQQAQTGNLFLPLASEFGPVRYAYAARTATGIQYEYLPVGETLERWQHLATVTLVQVGSSWEEGSAVLPRYVQAFRQQVNVHEEAAFSGKAGDVAFTRYQTGGGAIEEHNLAATWQIAPGTLATFQVQQRVGPPSEALIEHFKKVAARIAQIPTQ